jgi:NAD(P)-dependent dehydrogenase (short-subunit alcohol dehydrogenase family)
MPQSWKTIVSIAGGIAAAAGAVNLYLRNSRRINLNGKTVLITGGSRGLGLVLARSFGDKGARVSICARSERELDRVRTEFAEAGKPLFAAVCDVGVRAEVGRLIASVQERFGDIDILVNNAGTILVGPVENQDTQLFEDVMQTNFWGPHYAIAAVLPQMKNRQFGRIINIASIGGKVAFPHLLPYTASKFALVGYSEGLRAELTQHNVFVTTVCPGLMRTGSPRNADFTGQPEKEYAWFAISDSLPLSSIAARTAARKILDACIHGDAEIHLGLTAKLGAMVQGFAPGTTAEILSLVNRYMPEPALGKPPVQKGTESETPVVRTVAPNLRAAEIANNQL